MDSGCSALLRNSLPAIFSRSASRRTTETALISTGVRTIRVLTLPSPLPCRGGVGRAARGASGADWDWEDSCAPAAVGPAQMARAPATNTLATQLGLSARNFDVVHIDLSLCWEHETKHQCIHVVQRDAGVVHDE